MKIHIVHVTMHCNAPPQQRTIDQSETNRGTYISIKWKFHCSQIRNSAVISDLPEKIDRVWDGIIEDTAVRNMFGRNYGGKEYSLLDQEI